MTPASVIGLARLAGAGFAAVTDHNSALNLPAAEIAAREYGIRLLPGIEVNSAEEIHLLCYFPSVENALKMGETIYEKLPAVHYDPKIWGAQLVMDENDAVIGRVDKLLTAACSLDIYEVKRLCESLGGLCVPAHAEKDSYSLLSVLGFCPDDLDFPILELADPDKYPALVSRGFLPPGREIISSSDAHNLAAVGSRLRELPETSALLTLP
jgi:hypothetical protein